MAWSGVIKSTIHLDFHCQRLKKKLQVAKLLGSAHFRQCVQVEGKQVPSTVNVKVVLTSSSNISLVVLYLFFVIW